MSEWIHDNGRTAKQGELMEAVVRHCNHDLELPDESIKGRFKEDGFYFEDGGELSRNWDIIKWRYENDRTRDN